MKKIIIITLFVLSILVTTGCQQSKPVSNETTYTINYDTQGGTKVPSATVDQNTIPTVPNAVPFRDTFIFKYWSLEPNGEEYKFDSLLTEDITLYAVWVSELPDYSNIIDLFVPDVVTSKLELPGFYEGLRLVWSSSNENIIKFDGNVYRPISDKKVTVSLQVYDDTDSYTYEKETVVKERELKTLVPGNIVIGYYASWNFAGYNDQIVDTCDIINVCFAYVTDDYKLDLREVENKLAGFRAAHDKKVRVLLSVQGYGAKGKNFSNAAKLPTTRQKLADSMLEVLLKYDLDGIDIDWEYPGYLTGTDTATDRRNYTHLMRTIYTTLKNESENFLLTAAIPAGPTSSRFELDKVHNYFDYINIMTYDLNSGSASHHTALYNSYNTPYGSVDSGVKTFVAKGVPKEKIIIGLAFYGKMFTTTSMGSASQAPKTILYTEIFNKYLPKIGTSVEYYFDSVAKAPYLVDKANGTLISFDDKESVKLKCKYAQENKLGGVMIWEIGEDQTYTLLSEVYDVMKYFD